LLQAGAYGFGQHHVVFNQQNSNRGFHGGDFATEAIKEFLKTKPAPCGHDTTNPT
jgi:hypothetical protein